MVRLNRIYTRTGDDGTSGLVDGSRLPKHAPRFEAVGAVDEANSVIGWAMLGQGRLPTERAMTWLAAEEPINPAGLAYINRLSDYLFVLARAMNADGAGDVLWVPG